MFVVMSVNEVIEQIKALSPEERATVARFVLEHDDRVPEDFKAAMNDLETGRLVNMETVLSGATPPSRQRFEAALRNLLSRPLRGLDIPVEALRRENLYDDPE